MAQSARWKRSPTAKPKSKILLMESWGQWEPVGKFLALAWRNYQQEN